MPKFTASLNLPKYATAPSSPADGDVYYDTTDNKVYSRISGAWVDLAPSGAGSGDVTLTGTQTLTNKTLTDPKVGGTLTVDNNASTPIGIGGVTGAVVHAVGVDSSSTAALVDAHGTGVSGTFATRLSRGTAASPSAVQSGDTLGKVSVLGYGTSDFPSTNSGSLKFDATENHTNSNRGTKAVIQVTANGGSSLYDGLTVTSGGADISLGASYKIDGTDVLSAASLGSAVVSSSLTSVGTVTAGTWNGTTIGIAYGGTGQDTVGEAINALLPVQTSHSGKFLTTNGTDPAWGDTNNVTIDGGGA